MNKILSFKKNVYGSFFMTFFFVFVLAGVAQTAQASFLDWFNLNKANNNSQQQATAIANAETTYKWVNNGSVSKSDSRATGNCSSKKQVTTYTCNSSTKGNKLYDGTSKGSSYGDIGHAWPIYEGENTSTATEYTYDGCSQTVHNTSGTVNEWECKSSDTTTTTSSSSSSSSSYSYTATTKDATSPTSTSATLNGTVNPGGEKVHYIFSYRKESESASNTKYVPSGYGTVESGTSNVSVSTDLSGLSSGTKYVYRLYVLNNSYKNSTYGDSKSFTTSGSSSSVSSSSSVQQYTLKVKISGAGKITSSGGSGVVSCKKSVDSKGKSETSGDCSVKFNKGESVTLTPSTPSSKYEFATWAEDCRSAQKLSSCTIKMSGNKTVSATFNKKSGSSENTATVSVRKTGKGVGKVVTIGGSSGGINCGNDCSENFKQSCDFEVEGNKRCGTVYLKATADKGSAFGGWGGDCLTVKNAKDQCYVILDGDKSVNASFNEGSGNTEGKYFDLTVTVSAGGKVATTDSKISCDSSNSPCKHSYGKNGTVTLKATPNSGYALSSTGGCNSAKTKNSDGSYTCKVKITSNQKLSVSFKASGTSSSSSSSSSSKTSSSSTSANHTATTGSVTNKTSTSVTLNGTVNPKGENVYYIFSYFKKGVSGTNKTTGWKSAGSGSSDVSASADISGLSSGTTYYYWLSAYSYTTKAYVNSLNGDNGAAKTFTTSGTSSNSSSSSSSSSSFSSNTSADGLTINKSGSGSGKVIIKTSSGAELQTCDFTGSSSSCNYNPSATDSVFLYATVNSGSSFGGITNCSGGSNLTSDHTSGHCGVLMNNKSTVTVTFN